MITASSENIDNAGTSNLTADIIAYFIEEELKEYFGIENNENHQTVFTKAPIITDSSRVKVSYGTNVSEQDVVYTDEILFDLTSPLPYTLTEYPPYEYSYTEKAVVNIVSVVMTISTLNTPMYSIIQSKIVRNESSDESSNVQMTKEALVPPHNVIISQTINIGDRTYKRRFNTTGLMPLHDDSITSNLTSEGLAVDAQRLDGYSSCSLHSGGLNTESNVEGVIHEARYETDALELKRFPTDSDETMVYINCVDGLQTYNFTTQEATGLNNKKLMIHDSVNNKLSELSTEELVIENTGGENNKCSVGSGQIRMSDYNGDSSHTTITKTSIDMNYGSAGASTTGMLLSGEYGITSRKALPDNLILSTTLSGDGIISRNHSTKGTTELNTSRVALTEVDSNNDVRKQGKMTTSELTFTDNTLNPTVEVSLDATKINTLLEIITAWNNTSSGNSLVKP